MTTGVICFHAWLVTRIKNLDSVHGDRLTALLRRLEPVGGIEAYIQALGFMPWGRKFKLCHDDTILRNFMTLPPRDIDFLPFHFAAEATVRGNGPNTRNFGDPLDASALRNMDTYMEPYGGELMLTIQSVEIDTDESDSSSEDDESDSSSEGLHMPELEYVVNDGNGQSTHASPH